VDGRDQLDVALPRLYSKRWIPSMTRFALLRWAVNEDGLATREALLSEAGFENVFRTQNWARRRKLFCR